MVFVVPRDVAKWLLLCIIVFLKCLINDTATVLVSCLFLQLIVRGVVVSGNQFPEKIRVKESIDETSCKLCEIIIILRCTAAEHSCSSTEVTRLSTKHASSSG